VVGRPVTVQLTNCSFRIVTLGITCCTRLHRQETMYTLYECYLVYCTDKGCTQYSDLDAMTAQIYLCWNYSATNVAPTQKDLPLPHPKGDQFLNMYMSKTVKILVMDWPIDQPTVDRRKFPWCTPVREFHMAFHVLYIFYYITKLCRQQTEVI
jgi:hypothetical protein